MKPNVLRGSDWFNAGLRCAQPNLRPATAKTHVSRLLAKLHARDRAQLVMLAYEAGVVTPGAGVITSYSIHYTKLYDRSP